MVYKTQQGRKMARSKKPKIDSIDSIASKFAELRGAPKSKVKPPNSITSAEYAQYAQVSDRAASAWLLKLFKEGKCNRVKIQNRFYYFFNEKDA